MDCSMDVRLKPADPRRSPRRRRTQPERTLSPKGRERYSLALVKRLMRERAKLTGTQLALFLQAHMRHRRLDKTWIARFAEKSTGRNDFDELYAYQEVFGTPVGFVHLIAHIAAQYQAAGDRVDDLAGRRGAIWSELRALFNTLRAFSDDLLQEHNTRMKANYRANDGAELEALIRAMVGRCQRGYLYRVPDASTLRVPRSAPSRKKKRATRKVEGAGFTVELDD